MQFDRVESTQPRALSADCGVCRKSVTDVYYLAGNQKVCAGCRDAHQKQLENGSKAARVIKALLLGFVAAAVGGALWAFITYKSDGTVYGIVAIGLGLLVGAAVKKGAEGRGGRGFQILAMALTYFGVAIGYSGAVIPMAFKGKPATAEASADKPAGEKPADSAEPTKVVPKDHPGALAGGCLVAFIALMGMFIASPILVAVESPITLVFLAIALWEAWKLNRGLAVRLSGPFRLGASSPGKGASG
jgi:hypothetical protein